MTFENAEEKMSLKRRRKKNLKNQEKRSLKDRREKKNFKMILRKKIN